jgi:hypothetical protein
MILGLLFWKIDLIIDEHGIGGNDCKMIPILEDDSISSTFRAHIHFCLGKGTGLWLMVKPSIYSFHIAHSTFTLELCCHFGLIQPSTFNLFTCECGHGLNTYGTHVKCPFRGQRITTHDTIRDFMYIVAWKNGHDVWREWWYALMLGPSLRANLYMIHED